MTRLVLPLVLVAACAHTVATPPAPDPDRLAITAMVESFRAGIIARDTDKLRPLFLGDAVPFVGVSMRDGAPDARPGDAGGFIRALAAAEHPWEERFSDIDIRVDAGVAVMVSRYGFYEDHKMTNQGQEIWSLVKTKEGWKVASVIWSIKPPA